MNKFLKNFKDLYSDDDNVVYQALLEKKDWILQDLYMPGDLTITVSEDGSKHFKMLEDLVNDSILLDSYPFMDNIYKGMNEGFKNLRYKVFFKNIKKNRTNLFWVKYDFASITKSNYQRLVANYYPRLKEEELEIGTSDFASLLDAMKVLMIGDEDESIIILHTDDLSDQYMEAPKIKTIVVHSSAAKEIKEALKQVAKAKNCEYEEANYE